MRASVLIPTFERNSVLKLNLESLARQKPSDIEVFVLDDRFDEDEVCLELVEQFSKELDIHYIHTGQTKTNNYWRIPGFPLNIGAKQAKGEQLIVCCAEMLHVNDTLTKLIEPLEEHPQRLTIPQGKREEKSEVRKQISRLGRPLNDEEFWRIPQNLNVRYPFLMGINKGIFMDIGGYDEDFTGITADDDDLIGRLRHAGCVHYQTEAKAIHLHHSTIRKGDGLQQNVPARIDYNRKLWMHRMGKIVRNEDREWGICD